MATLEVIYYSRDFPGAIALNDAFYIDRRIGPHEVTPLLFTSTDGKLLLILVTSTSPGGTPSPFAVVVIFTSSLTPAWLYHNVQFRTLGYHND